MANTCIAAACNPKNVCCYEVWVGLCCVASRVRIGGSSLSSCHMRFAVSSDTQA